MYGKKFAPAYVKMKKVKKLIALLIIITASPVWAVETIPRTPQMKTALFNDLSADLACLCGCGTTLKACPHDSCSFAVPTRKSILKMIDAGLSRETIVARLVAKRGEAILAAPTFSGFNLVAWITPFAAIFLVGFGIVAMLRSWSGKQKLAGVTESAAGGVPVDDINESDPQYKRLREELERFDS